MSKIFTVKGSKWAIRDLLYEEAQDVRDIRKLWLDTLADGGKLKLGEFIDKIYSDGNAQKIVPLLKPYARSWKDRIVNWLIRRFHGITSQKLINFMTEQQVVEVIADFFTESGRSTQMYANMLSGLDFGEENQKTI